MKKLNDKILIYGNGQIGNFYLNHFKNSGLLNTKISEVNITKEGDLKKEFYNFNPTVVINTAAKTNLEWVDAHKLESFNVNVLAADNIAKLCDQENVYHIFLSSGCIFESKEVNDLKDENSEPAPQAFYSWTKVWAENLITWKKSNNFKYLILRPRQPVSKQISYKNMLIKFLTFTKFVDTPNTGTVIEDLMKWTDMLIYKRTTGTLNVANKGWSTPYKIALVLKEYILPELPVKLITKEELNNITPVQRVDTVLDVSKLESIVGKENVPDFEKRINETILGLADNLKNTDVNIIKRELEKTIKQTKQRTTANKCWSNLFTT